MKPGMQWPIGIVVILAASVVANIVFMRVANNDPSFAIEPDYYKRAVAYDTTMQETRVSDALGWSAAVTIGEVNDGQAVLRVEMHDRSGAPLIVDSLKASAFFIARANDVARVTLHPDTGLAHGIYSAAIPVQHAGQWEVQLDARRGADHFVTSTRANVVFGSHPATRVPAADSANRSGQ